MNEPHLGAHAPSRRALLSAGAGVALGATVGCRTTRADDGAAWDDDALDRRLGPLEDQSARYTPIDFEERIERRVRLAQVLRASNLGGLLVEPGATMTYLTGVSWGRSERLFALALLADGSSVWIVPAFEAPRAEERVLRVGGDPPAIVTWDEHEYAFAPLAAELEKRGVKRIAIEPQTRWFVADRLATALGPERVVDGSPITRILRSAKSPSELALLRGANELTQRAIARVAETLEPGMTDHQIGALIARAQRRLGLRSTWVLPLIGANAAYPHGSPNGAVLGEGDLVLVDTGGSLHDYQSDITRTWSLGAPGPEVERAWSVVRDAQLRAFETLAPGVRASDVDAAARAVIVAAGYGEGYEAFAHRLGHGIGLEGHEEPYLDGGNELTLDPGMTFSDEPGIYVPGRFGIRIEDIVVVTEDGGDHFGSWQTSVRSPA